MSSIEEMQKMQLCGNYGLGQGVALGNIATPEPPPPTGLLGRLERAHKRLSEIVGRMDNVGRQLQSHQDDEYQEGASAAGQMPALPASAYLEIIENDIMKAFRALKHIEESL